MEPHILTIPDDGVYRKLLRLATAPGLHVAEVSKPAGRATDYAVRPALSAEERAYHLAIIEKGGDGKSFADPVAWRREERRDRSLPGRD